jgi:alpha-mannosidase
VVSDEPSVLTISEDGRTMANSYWKLRFADDGSIEELYDRTRKRSVLAPGQKGNLWQIFEDRPHQYDAWEVDPGTYDQPPLPAPTLESMSVVESGRVRVAVELVWTLPPSPPTAEQETTTIRQRVALYAGNPRIDFETTVDWHEHHQLLKVAFPVDVYAQVATYEV